MGKVGETAVYVVLGILILAFIFFVGNTIRCYLNKPKFDEDDDGELELDSHVSGTKI